MPHRPSEAPRRPADRPTRQGQARISRTATNEKINQPPKPRIPAEYALPGDGEFAAAERHRTARSGGSCRCSFRVAVWDGDRSLVRFACLDVTTRNSCELAWLYCRFRDHAF